VTFVCVCVCVCVDRAIRKEEEWCQRIVSTMLSTHGVCVLPKDKAAMFLLLCFSASWGNPSLAASLPGHHLCEIPRLLEQSTTK
jgi:hypothetical protein